MEHFIFMRQLTKNIENELSGLLVEKHLYNFIRDFLYSSMKLMFRTNGYQNTPFYIKLPIIGSNYFVTYDKTIIEQVKTNLFKELVADKEHIIEIFGDFETFGYEKLSRKSNNYVFVGSWCSFSLIKVIDYGTNPELKTINVSNYVNIECPINIPIIEKFVWDTYVFIYGVRIQ